MTTPAQSEAARQLAALIPSATYACANCRKVFEARANKKPDAARTCSASCRTTLYMRRKKQREAAGQ